MAAEGESPNSMLRIGYLGLGATLAGLGWIGWFVPGMPSTIFFILALWAFKKSSPRLEAKLLNSRLVGPTLRDWDETRSITLRTKIVAIATMMAFALVSVVLIPKLWIKVLVAATVVAVAVYLWTRKTKPA